MENISIEEIIENLGLLKAIEDQVHDLVEKGKNEIKAKGINVTNTTATIKTSDKTAKAYTLENEKKLQRIKQKCAEAIAAIPYEETVIKNNSVKIVSAVTADEKALQTIKDLFIQ